MRETPFSHTVAVETLPETGQHVKLAPDAEARAAIARHLGVEALPELKADLHVLPAGRGGAHVTGTISAQVRQNCVVTLEPFDAPVKESVDVRFAPEEEVARFGSEGEDEGDLAAEPPDPVIGGQIDMGALVTEFLALGIDPYPRKPGAVFTAPAEADAPLSPFSALARLKDQD